MGESHKNERVPLTRYSMYLDIHVLTISNTLERASTNQFNRDKMTSVFSLPIRAWVILKECFRSTFNVEVFASYIAVGTFKPFSRKNMFTGRTLYHTLYVFAC